MILDFFTICLKGKIVSTVRCCSCPFSVAEYRKNLCLRILTQWDGNATIVIDVYCSIG